MTIFARIAAALVTLFGLTLGLWFYLATAAAAEAFFVEPIGAAGLATLRADMSSFFLVGAGFALHAAITGRGKGLVVPAALYAVAISGRALNLLMHSHDGALTPMAVEAVLILLCVFGYRALRPAA